MTFPSGIMIIHHDPRDGVALAAFKSEWWPASRRNSGRLQIGTPGRLRRNTHLLVRMRFGGRCHGFGKPLFFERLSGLGIALRVHRPGFLLE